jgi:hypothetical protein
MLGESYRFRGATPRRTVKARTLTAAASAVAIAAVLLLVASLHRPGFTIRQVKSELRGRGAESLTFSITNHTASQYYIYAQSAVVEAKQGGTWAQCWADPFPTVIDFALYPHRSKLFTVRAMNLPHDRLRLRVPVNKQLDGLEGLGKRIATKWKLRKMPAIVNSISLNPFSKHDTIWGEPFPIFSEEFVGP